MLTMNVRYCSFRAHSTCGIHWLKNSKRNYHPSTPSQSIKVLTEHLSARHGIQVHLQLSTGNYSVLNWIIATTWLHMNWCVLASRQVSVLALWSLVELWGDWWMINVFGNFFNQIIQFLNACIDPETAVTCTHGHFNHSVYAHFGQIR